MLLPINCFAVAFLVATQAGLGLCMSYSAVSFGDSVTVLDRNITCSPFKADQMYPNPVYVCNDIKVDGVPLLHGFNIAPPKNQPLQCDDLCPCGFHEDEPNDVVTLCKRLLSESGVTFNKFISASTPVPSCDQRGPEWRVKFYYDVDSETSSWLDVHANNGFVTKLECIVS